MNSLQDRAREEAERIIAQVIFYYTNSNASMANQHITDLLLRFLQSEARPLVDSLIQISKSDCIDCLSAKHAKKSLSEWRKIEELKNENKN